MSKTNITDAELEWITAIHKRVLDGSIGEGELYVEMRNHFKPPRKPKEPRDPLAALAAAHRRRSGG